MGPMWNDCGKLSLIFDNLSAKVLSNLMRSLRNIKEVRALTLWTGPNLNFSVQGAKKPHWGR